MSKREREEAGKAMRAMTNSGFNTAERLAAVTAERDGLVRNVLATTEGWNKCTAERDALQALVNDLAVLERYVERNEPTAIYAPPDLLARLDAAAKAER